MAEEFTIKSQNIENKINQLLPSQGGFQPGIDFSASTMVVPVVDLTETAEGSVLREDLQTAYSFDITANTVSNGTVTVINTPGFYQCYASAGVMNAGGNNDQRIEIFDGTTAKTLIDFDVIANVNTSEGTFQQFKVCIGAGESVRVVSDQTNSPIHFVSRQIATITGVLVNPTALQS